MNDEVMKHVAEMQIPACSPFPDLPIFQLPPPAPHTHTHTPADNSSHCLHCRAHLSNAGTVRDRPASLSLR